MGREIRRVPANWEHPKSEDPYGRERLQPMYDSTFADAASEWKEAFAAWERGERPSYCSEDSKHLEYWEWENSPPTREYYRPWKDDEATWFQLWETVSEGTPVTPPFATKEELADHLAEHGDAWDQERCNDPGSCRLFGLTPGKPGWGKKKAYAFVMGDGWAPSMVAVGGQVMSGVDFVASRTDKQ